MSCKICRPFSSSTSCSLPSSPPRLRAAHCCLLSVRSFPFWFVALAAGAQQGPLLGDVAMLREGDGFGACVCGLRRRRTSGAPPKFRRVAAGGPRPRRAPLCDAWYAEADEMRRRTYILLCSSDIFSFFSCVGSIHLLCALVFVHVRLPILDSTVLECLPNYPVVLVLPFYFCLFHCDCFSFLWIRSTRDFCSSLLHVLCTCESYLHSIIACRVLILCTLLPFLL